MSTYAWNDTFSVHVQQFDAQHQRLFEIIDALADAVRAGKDDEVIREVVSQLAVYTRTHFLQEEVAMRQTGYPGLNAHKAQHNAFMATIEKYKSDLAEGRSPDSADVLALLNNWLVQHIQKTDREYSSHLNAHGLQ